MTLEEGTDWIDRRAVINLTLCTLIRVVSYSAVSRVGVKSSYLHNHSHRPP